MNLLSFPKRKIKKNKITATREIKELSVLSYWCSSHKNCFRGSIGKGETEVHLDTKYARWKHWRKHGYDVYVELRLKSGLRPDLTMVSDRGEIFHEEVLVSEKEASLFKKQNNYPYLVRAFYASNTTKL